MEKTPYIGHQLRTDGYYYQLTDGGKYQSPYCFCRNEVLLDLGGIFPSEDEKDAYIKREFIQDHRYSALKSVWGVFVINGQSIKFEHYYISDQLNKAAYIREGTILDNETFHLTVSYRSDGSERREKDEMYHFRPFSHHSGQATPSNSIHLHDLSMNKPCILKHIFIFVLFKVLL